MKLRFRRDRPNHHVAASQTCTASSAESKVPSQHYFVRRIEGAELAAHATGGYFCREIAGGPHTES
jgi:hypothetical protein